MIDSIWQITLSKVILYYDNKLIYVDTRSYESDCYMLHYYKNLKFKLFKKTLSRKNSRL